MAVDQNLLRVLEARERRWNRRIALAREGDGALISITLCLPEAYRTNPEYQTLFLSLCRVVYHRLLTAGFDCTLSGWSADADGPVFYLKVRGDILAVKRACVEAEEQIPGGRMLDIDLMNQDGTPISRKDAGLEPRTCFLCGRPAAECVASRRHSREEVNRKAEEYYQTALAGLPAPLTPENQFGGK